jgi:WD40 repeat protein
MKKTIGRISLIAVVLMAATACKQTPDLPAESSEPVPEQEPVPVVITSENAAALKPVYSASVSTGFILAKWTDDSTAVWIMDSESAALYDSTSFEITAQFTPGANTVIYDVSPDGKTVAYSQDGLEIHLFDISAQADIVSIVPDFDFSNAFFNTDGTLLGMSSLYDIEIVLWDTASGAEMGSLRGYRTAAPVYDAIFGMDGKTLLWFSRGTVQPMDIATQKMGPTLSHEDFVTARQISPNGKVVATTAAGTVGDEFQPVLTLWDADSGEILRQNAIPSYFSSIAFSPDNGLLAAGTEDGVLFFSVPHGDEVFSFDSAEVVNSIAFSPDGVKLITCGNEGTINIYEVDE